MKKIDISSLLLFATIMVLSYKCYILYQNSERLSYSISQYEQKAAFCAQEVMLNARYETYASKNSYVNVFKEKADLLDSDFKMVNTDSLLRKTKFVMRIPSEVCNPCYDSIYGILIRKLPKNKIDEFIIIVDLNSLKDYKVYFKELGLSKHVFGIKTGFYVSKELDNQSFPYLIHKDSDDKRFRFLFVINKDSKMRLVEYLKIIAKY